eukprot:CAMPEP_0118922218 /NCGR_PEP_ID=MMETSP1169-20130426/1216_1 /TAXON_ID=36882 /ORGANISM="Pyramimonas obovata, Strain CCMP722" /LENGTH=131 /DNA_ID=CAMNT_0006863049 /DNA_START=53 /DNA_END=448 /DNA_ORIENTATION=+
MGEYYTDDIEEYKSPLADLSKTTAVFLLVALGLFALLLQKVPEGTKPVVGLVFGGILGAIGLATVGDELPVSGAVPGAMMGLMFGTIAHFADKYAGEYIANLDKEDTAEETNEDSKSKDVKGKKGKRTKRM